MDHLRRFNHVVGAVTQAMREGRLGFSLQQVNPIDEAGAVFYSQCLGRLVERDGEVRTSDEFTAFLEASGRVASYDRYMVGLALEWLECNPSHVLGCKISTGNIFDEHAWSEFHDLLSRNREMAPRLVLEISESLPLATLPTAVAFLEGVRALGCKIALDSFGTGHSTPESLLSFSVDIVKLDAFFIGRGGKDFLHHLVGLASCVAPMVVVEGIETYAQFEVAKRAGATHVQGFLLSEPTLYPVYCGQPAPPLAALHSTAGYRQLHS
ncbi:EAL domain-containing protein [Sinorhizobium medicae]|uniref:EAL domain-containing protein n=1 Tax=Sinorhizobium medicae TaxID=110321 RepID=UPI0011A8D2B0|nr:EAL domain-containing protein [Sinorhizobium medicae]MDX0464521.1 EAL domain-containing protein [Sinorhizobium medicae]MDX1171632.1 EAL domain-containing protein [Sinorhizobium medicae]MDX1245020.1 EAL domain-containing protein [Sinorhizobium medicae]TWA42054.1 EAL domain-containing protein (putative c-di-GMP-specific phosphodiesterase class I) [Sinorhizobium medicae]